jgi:hypothetical protein
VADDAGEVPGEVEREPDEQAAAVEAADTASANAKVRMIFRDT